jgi:hypothetical protein
LAGRASWVRRCSMRRRCFCWSDFLRFIFFIACSAFLFYCLFTYIAISGGLGRRVSAWMHVRPLSGCGFCAGIYRFLSALFLIH